MANNILPDAECLDVFILQLYSEAEFDSDENWLLQMYKYRDFIHRQRPPVAPQATDGPTRPLVAPQKVVDVTDTTPACWM